MKKDMLYALLIICSLLAFGCEEKKTIDNLYVDYVTSVEVISPEALDVRLDDFAHFVAIDFPSYTNVTKVKIKLTLAAGVSMEEPKETLSEYDLSEEAVVKLRRGEAVVSFRIKPSFISVPWNPSTKGWEKVNNFGELPDYLSIYKYTQKVSGKSVKAYIGVADMNHKSVRFTVLGEAKGAQIPTKFYENSSNPKLILNGGYFWDGYSLGLILRDGETVKVAQPMVWRSYNGASTVYYPTQGVFGVTSDNVFQAHWAYHSGSKLYTYSAPAQNKAGEKPQPVPSDKFPEGAKVWKPQVAIGAGPILIKDGEYKNFWEAEMFGAKSGIGPTANSPRSAIAYVPSGELIFFVCEGRNQTPNVPGLTLKEVADLFLELGCTEVLNFDGGGSSCMLVNGKELIKPSDGQQRPITSMVAIY